MTDTMGPASLTGYFAKPPGAGPWPAILVIQEWWGLDAQTRSIADRLAAVGYFAFAPDLYHGELAPLGDSERASALVQKYGPAAPGELVEAFDTLKTHPDSDGRLASIGFCFGGRMALALALHRPLNAVCTYYGGGMHALFPELHRLRSPVLGLFGDEDQSIPADAVERFDELLDQAGVEHEVIVYPQAGHAFFRDTDPRVYVPAAAQDAWRRTTEFLSRHLPPHSKGAATG
jgi:carboxymethylenebutenolidase